MTKDIKIESFPGLKPCPNPWLPSQPLIVLALRYNDGSDSPTFDGYQGRCGVCGISSPSSLTIEGARENWNDRSSRGRGEAQ